MNDSIQIAIRMKNYAIQMLEDRIVQEVKAIAKREGYSSVMWNGYRTSYKDLLGNPVIDDELDDLEALYCDEVRPGGLEFYFEKDKDY